jgi:formate hydrogenlyase subunit 3/multisubunit Na+/H+ antiporter MnhD subunit
LSAPALWIALPFAAGLTLALVGARRLTGWWAAGVAGALALAAMFLPVDAPIPLGGSRLLVESALPVLGRRFVLADHARPLVALLYGSGFFWLGAMRAFGYPRRDGGVGLAALAALTAALAIQPIIYAPLFIFAAALVCVPLLAPPEGGASRAAQVFVTFQLLALPFLLTASSMLAGLEGSPAGLETVARPGALLGGGFLLLLGVFPFHAWLPVVAEHSRPLAGAFVLAVFPLAALVWGVQLMERFVWMRNAPEVHTLLRFTGMATLLAGGVWSAFQGNLARQLGFSALVETGLLLTALGLGAGGLPVVFALALARAASFLLWGAGLAELLRHAPAGDFASVAGLMWRAPLGGLAAALGHFSAAGLPLLAGFAARLALLDSLSSADPTAALGVWAGMLGMAIGATRALAALVTTGADHASPRKEGTLLRGRPSLRGAGLLLGCLLIPLMGIFPQWFARLSTLLAAAFPNLSP